MCAGTVALALVVGSVLEAVRVDGDKDVYPSCLQEVCHHRVLIVLCHQPLDEMQQNLTTRHLHN